MKSLLAMHQIELRQQSMHTLCSIHTSIIYIYITQFSNCFYLVTGYFLIKLKSSPLCPHIHVWTLMDVMTGTSPHYEGMLVVMMQQL